MEYNIEFEKARSLLLERVLPVGTRRIALEECEGLVLADSLIAGENVPSFDRSPYDGYAFRAADSQDASKAHPICLRIIEEVPAGAWPTKKVTKGTAVKILTGASIPEGADTVVMFEKTIFTQETIMISEPACSGDNIICAGEDVRAGTLLAEKGTVIDTGLLGTLASQGEFSPTVYQKPVVGLISTGNELADGEEPLSRGKIRNTNRYTIGGELKRCGCVPVYLGVAGDTEEEIAARILEGLARCDMVLLTGGVSVGDYDRTPAAMELAEAQMLVRGVDLKPGMACAYGEKDGKLILGLSGNPASAITNFYMIVLPVLKKLCGRKEYLPRETIVTLKDGFGKKSRSTRILRGCLDVSEGTLGMRIPKEQGNAVISSAIGCDILALVPSGSGPLSVGTRLRGFLL